MKTISSKFTYSILLVFLVIVIENAGVVSTNEFGAIPKFTEYSIIQHLLFASASILVMMVCYYHTERAGNIIFYLSVLTGGMYIYRFSILDEVILLMGLLNYSRKESAAIG